MAHLKGPEKDGKRDPVYFATRSDYVDDFNDKLDNQAEATTTRAGLMSAADKTKLDNISEGATNYILPAATNSTLGGVKIGSGINISNGTISIANATTSANGLMSAADKSKLDGVANNAQVNVIESVKVNGTALSVTNKAVNIDISGKVDKVSGKVLSTNDYTTDEKNKLAGIAAGANNYTLPDATTSVKGGVKIGTGINISNGTISVANATTSANGLMSSADKSKLDDLEKNYIPRITAIAFNIPVSSWAKNNSETSEFVYYADITASGLTSNDYAEINFSRASQSIVSEANLCASGETLSGKIRLYAEKIPAANISGEYIITKGAV